MNIIVLPEMTGRRERPTDGMTWRRGREREWGDAVKEWSKAWFTGTDDPVGSNPKLEALFTSVTKSTPKMTPSNKTALPAFPYLFQNQKAQST